MQGILYEEPSFFLFALISILMGGWAVQKRLQEKWLPLFVKQTRQ